MQSFLWVFLPFKNYSWLVKTENNNRQKNFKTEIQIDKWKSEQMCVYFYDISSGQVRISGCRIYRQSCETILITFANFVSIPFLQFKLKITHFPIECEFLVKVTRELTDCGDGIMKLELMYRRYQQWPWSHYTHPTCYRGLGVSWKQTQTQEG